MWRKEGRENVEVEVRAPDAGEEPQGGGGGEAERPVVEEAGGRRELHPLPRPGLDEAEDGEAAHHLEGREGVKGLLPSHLHNPPLSQASHGRQLTCGRAQLS